VASQIERSLDLGVAIPAGRDSSAPDLRLLDLGSGGGLPGIPLACALPETDWILLEGGTRRAEFLRQAVVRLGIAGRVTVIPDRAEVAGRTDHRGTLDVVVARGFGPPAVTAECAAPFLRVGGTLIVAEPPGDPIVGRWPDDGLVLLGLARSDRSESGFTTWQAFTQVQGCPDRFPRRTGMPNKRPLF
jgi:16S rRNA (guanine527-N7)-methyltransferase